MRIEERKTPIRIRFPLHESESENRRKYELDFYVAIALGRFLKVERKVPNDQTSLRVHCLRSLCWMAMEICDGNNRLDEFIAKNDGQNAPGKCTNTAVCLARTRLSS